MISYLFPGSFDPFTRGHKDIARRAAALCDRLYVVVMQNSSKKCAFDLDERVAMASEVLKDFSNIEVMGSGGLLVDIYNKLGCNAAVRGIRSESDFRYEAEMALANKLLRPEYDVVLLPCRYDLSFTSSSIVKEVASFGGDISKMVPSEIEDKVKQRLMKGSN